MTVLNDDGRVSWGNLSAGEKVARTTQQSFNFSMIILGAVLTVRNVIAHLPLPKLISWIHRAE